MVVFLHLLVFFLTSLAFVMTKRGAPEAGAVLFLATAGVCFWFLGWWSLAAVVAGMFVGGQLVLAANRKDIEEQEQINEWMKKHGPL
jgi:hypothetical protein